MKPTISNLLTVIDTFQAMHPGLELVTLSYRVFGDSKKIDALRDDKEITVGRFNGAMEWFVGHWPDGEEMPDALRPYLPAAEQDAA